MMGVLDVPGLLGAAGVQERLHLIGQRRFHEGVVRAGTQDALVADDACVVRVHEQLVAGVLPQWLRGALRRRHRRQPPARSSRGVARWLRPRLRRGARTPIGSAGHVRDRPRPFVSRGPARLRGRSSRPRAWKDTDQQPADQERAHRCADDREHGQQRSLVFDPVRDRRRVRQVDVGRVAQPIDAVR